MEPIKPIDASVPQSTDPSASSQIALQSKNKKSLLFAVTTILLVAVAVAVAGYVYFISPQVADHKKLQQMTEQADRVNQIKKIVEGGDMAALSRDDYSLYLQSPFDIKKYLAEDEIYTTAGAFTISMGDEIRDDLVIAGPKVYFEGLYFFVDSAVTKDGKNIITGDSFEGQKKSIFTEVDGYEKVNEEDGGAYWFGERGLRLGHSISDIASISGKIVVPFYENAESVMITAGDTEKTLASGVLSAISFSGSEFSANYSGKLPLALIKAYDAAGTELKYKTQSIFGQEHSVIDGEYDGVPHTVRITFGSLNDIDIPFSWQLPAVKQAEPVETVQPKAEEKPEVIWSPVADAQEKKDLQQAIGALTKLFQDGDIKGVIEYAKIAKLSISSESAGKPEEELKKEVAWMADTIMKSTAAQIASNTSVLYEKALNPSKEQVWAVSGVPAIDPFFEEPITLIFYLKKINGTLYVVDFQNE